MNRKTINTILATAILMVILPVYAQAADDYFVYVEGVNTSFTISFGKERVNTSLTLLMLQSVERIFCDALWILTNKNESIQ